LSETENEANAAAALSPVMRTAMLYPTVAHLPRDNTEHYYRELEGQAAKAMAGDSTRAAQMLFCHAHTLDALIGILLEKAAADPRSSDAYLQQALTAQEQCRRTWETFNQVRLSAKPSASSGQARTNARKSRPARSKAKAVRA
jgi:hypothetical protein